MMRRNHCLERIRSYRIRRSVRCFTPHSRLTPRTIGTEPFQTCRCSCRYRSAVLADHTHARGRLAARREPPSRSGVSQGPRPKVRQHPGARWKRCPRRLVSGGDRPRKGEPLFVRCRYRQVAGSIRWEPVGRGSWQTASELTRPWADIRNLAALPDVIPYALRHCSIVRGIRPGLPIRLVAALHDPSVQMIEKHYARWIADGLEELAARAVVPLVPGQRTLLRTGSTLRASRQTWRS